MSLPSPRSYPSSTDLGEQVPFKAEQGRDRFAAQVLAASNATQVQFVAQGQYQLQAPANLWT